MKIVALARNHWRHHNRFYLSAVLGGVAWAAGWTLEPRLRAALAGDVFYAAYLIWAFILINRLGPSEMRRKSSVEDEGVHVILLLTILSIGFSIASLIGVLQEGSQSHLTLLAAAVASVPLGWFTLHVIFGFRYGHLYYEQAQTKGQKGDDAGGLEFPGTAEPTAWDFVYHAFVVGATAQVSDVQITNTRMRKLTWLHSMISFFYNTVLIALTVNIAVQKN